MFGPYSDDPKANYFNAAKMRSTPAYFQDASGRTRLFVAGSTKSAAVSSTAVPPSLARLAVVTSPGAPAYLSIDATDGELAFINPGSPVVTSHASQDPVVWVWDENAQRGQYLMTTNTNHPVLYAVDGTTMKLLWSSFNTNTQKGSGEPLAIGGKYVTPVVAHGVVYVGTDRVQAFGLLP